jgi:putative RNA 2'-phosphotransferase
MRYNIDMTDDIRTSKFLSRILRHSPEKFGLTLEPGGWVPVTDLLKATGIDRSTLERVVANNDKKRYSFNEAGDKIRANQGHSVEVDLQLEPVTPPALLFHGTASRTVPLIMESGLKRMARSHVHLSLDVETAVKVGGRHGKPIVLEVAALAMHEAGFEFYCADNGVWLTEHVPVAYLAICR